MYFEHFGYRANADGMELEGVLSMFSLIMEMVESTVIADRHSNFEANIMQSIIYHNNTLNVEWGRTVRNKDNMEQSLLSAQRICRIQSAVQQFNDRLGDADGMKIDWVTHTNISADYRSPQFCQWQHS